MIASVEALPLDAEMNAPFSIATGAKTEVRNVLVRLRLKDGTVGLGEGAPMTISAGQTQEQVLRAARRGGAWLVGRRLDGFRPLLEGIEERIGPGLGAAKAALGMAVLDAWTRRAKIPLRLLFGGSGDRVYTDVTVTARPADAAREEARAILKKGIRAIKIKVGWDVEGDLERVLAVARLRPRPSLILDANCGFSPEQSLRLLAGLRKKGVRPALFEQPAAKDDWKGLAAVHRRSGVPVAADESASGRKEALALARSGAVQVLNIKLMKCGILEAWDMALIARAAGLGLMIGGMVESSLAMTCGAHFAAGLGGFDFIDLDTPLWFKKDPMTGVSIGKGGLYDLSRVKAGIGVTPGIS